MLRKKGFTLIELLVVVAIIALLIGILLPSLGRARELANRTMCGTRLKGLYTALAVYGASNKDVFPSYLGKPASPITSFTDLTNRDAGAPERNSSNTGFVPKDIYGELLGSITAPWWGIVRDSSVGAKNYLCPSNKDAVEDNLTDNNTPPGATDLLATWDFTLKVNDIDTGIKQATTSYSMGSTYTNFGRVQWGADTNADWVFLADDNNITTPAGTDPIHTLHKSMDPPPSVERAKNAENSLDHKGEGQNVLFGDGHASFEDDPWVGPSSDNIFATNTYDPATGETTSSVEIVLDDHEGMIGEPSSKKDIALAPVTGDGNIDDLVEDTDH